MLEFSVGLPGAFGPPEGRAGVKTQFLFAIPVNIAEHFFLGNVMRLRLSSEGLNPECALLLLTPVERKLLHSSKLEFQPIFLLSHSGDITQDCKVLRVLAVT